MTTTTDPILPTRLEDLVALFDVRPTDVPTPDAERAEALRAPKFGTVFTDHMARVSWTSADGWRDRRIEKYGPLQLDPATAVLHYAQEIFEGLKAYKHADSSDLDVPSRPERGALRPVGAPPRAARAQRGRLHRVAGRPGPHGHELGARRRGLVAVPAALHVRLRGVPRGAAGARGRVPGDRVAGRAVLLGRRQAGVDLRVRAVPPGRAARRYGRREVRRQLRREPAAAASRRRSRASTRSASSTRRPAPTSRSSAA